MGVKTPPIQYGQQVTLLNTTTITTALTNSTAGAPYGATGITGLGGSEYGVFQAVFTYGSGGTTADAYIQTSLDAGVTWVDVANFHFTTATATKISAITTRIAPAAQALTPTDGTLTNNTIIQGVMGGRFRVKLTTTGTYAGGTTLKIAAWFKA